MAEREQDPFVLYVDDEPLNLRVFEANFRGRFRILTAQSGAEALELLSSRGGEICVVISDQRMPGMSGVELLEKARELVPDVRRMLITAYSDMQAVMDAVNRGQVVRYFVKPWVREELGAALDDAVGIHLLQARLRDLQARMLRSERLAALGQVSAGIAHELMNPVSYVTQNVATLRRELELLRNWISPRLQQEPQSEVSQTLDDLPALLGDLESGTRHIRQVALGIRDQARGDDVETSAELRDVAGFATRIARGEIRQRARVKVDGPEVTVAVGPVKLLQVLLNLIVNSGQALEGLERAGLITVRWSVEGALVRIEVSDNGAGIPPELQARIFDPLFTTKAVGAGTGLGLPITREIVQGAGGTLRLESTPGEGTSVEITLPVVKGS